MDEMSWRQDAKSCVNDYLMYGKTPLEKRMAKLLQQVLELEK